MESNIKNIIKNYQYYELDETQKQLISEWASNSDEFDALKHAFIAADAIGEQEINPTIKQRLDVRFAEKFNKERLVWYNKLWLFLWPNDVSFYKRPLVQFAAICLIAVFSIPFFPNYDKQQLAMNETEKKNIVEEGKQDKQEKVIAPNKNDSEKGEEMDKVSSNDKDAVAEISEENIFEESEELAQEQVGWQLNPSPEEKSLEDNFGSAAISDQRNKDNQNLDDFEGVEESEQQDYKAGYLRADADAPIANSQSRATTSDRRSVRKKVETEETIDLLTALY